jgi:hypothetical protein
MTKINNQVISHLFFYNQKFTSKFFISVILIIRVIPTIVDSLRIGKGNEIYIGDQPLPIHFVSNIKSILAKVYWCIFGNYFLED